MLFNIVCFVIGYVFGIIAMCLLEINKEGEENE